MGTKVVAFSLLDVCLGLGLRVVGQNIDLTREGLDSHCNKLFGPNKVVDVEMVYDYLLKHSKHLEVNDFCKFYLLLGIFEFLLANLMVESFLFCSTLLLTFVVLGNIIGVVWCMGIWLEAFVKLKC